MDSHAVLAKVVDDTGDGGYDDSERLAFEESEAKAFLAVPFLRLSGEPGKRQLVVGQGRVIAKPDGGVELTLVRQTVRSEEAGWSEDTTSPAVTGLERISGLPLPSAYPAEGDAVSQAVTLAKAIAESSRNEVLRLRGLRYELERMIAELLARRRRGSLRPVLADIIELSTALGRGRDQAQKAGRDGLWIWLWDDETYHHVRNETTSELGEPTWVRTYRNALRHCTAMDEQLAEEVSRLHSLLTGISAFAVAADSEAQERFNLLAAVAAAGLGVPALIISLYGADSFLPLDSFDHAWRALLPIGVTVLVVSTVGLRWMPGKSRLRHYALAVLLVITLIGVLFFAGVLAPGK
ncbi:hypothetical protein JOF56_004583 [Kibdelosporangium banguiense]|uniref:Magnesium transporter n=1 Tax=Kibdelosporangium banguiense TaxID=1365924 RepID=A0ABS4TIE7_9PSEU|nr:hypothetical protein [Kibdelosporangium banguiense]MBP2324198.1 hypothetical protein [Kibdelosporangium banguiense]